MKKLLLLTTTIILLSSCVGTQAIKPSPCKSLGGGVVRCDYDKTYCMKSFMPTSMGITQTGLQCFEKKI